MWSNRIRLLFIVGNHLLYSDPMPLIKSSSKPCCVDKTYLKSLTRLSVTPSFADALDKRCEDLRFHNHTLLDDKKQLQECIDQMKEAGAKVREDGGLERELRELQDSLHQKDVQHSEELRNKDREMQQLSMVLEDTEYKYVIAHSELSEIKKEHEQQLTDLKDKVCSVALYTQWNPSNLDRPRLPQLVPMLYSWSAPFADSLQQPWMVRDRHSKVS